jgi:transporter family protein
MVHHTGMICCTHRVVLTVVKRRLVWRSKDGHFFREEFALRIPKALQARWFWCCMFCLACYVPWIFFSKLGGNEIPPRTMQYLFNWGGLPVGVLFLALRRFRLENNFKGISYGLIVGLLSALGQLALFGAYHGSANTSVVTVITSLFPLVTVILAVIFLRERLTRTQVAGIGFAIVAIAIFSF